MKLTYIGEILVLQDNTEGICQLLAKPVETERQPSRTDEDTVQCP